MENMNKKNEERKKVVHQKVHFPGAKGRTEKCACIIIIYRTTLKYLVFGKKRMFKVAHCAKSGKIQVFTFTQNEGHRSRFSIKMRFVFIFIISLFPLKFEKLN